MTDTARPPGSSTNSNLGDDKHAQAATAERLQDGPGATPNAGKETVAADEPTGKETKQTLRPDASKGGPGLSRYVPSWVAGNVKNPASLKILFRCWLASWAAFILILPTKNLTVLGNAAFFTVLCSFFMPPNLPIQTFLFAMSTMVIGVCLGWAFGAAGMAAALAARSQTLLAAAIQKTEQSAATATNPDAVFQIAVFEGVFLDTRSSVIMGVFLGVGTFLFALIRAYKPQFTLMSVFGTIAIDIFCTIGPLFPTGYYTIPEIILLPVAQYMAIAVFLIIFVFPETMSHAYLKTAVSILGIVQTILVLQDEVLSSDPHDIDMESALVLKLRGLREGMVKLYSSLGQRFKLINSEFSYGRWHSTDVQDLEQPLLGIVARINGLMSFVRYIGRKSHFFNEMSATSRDDTSTLHGSSHSHSQGDSYLLRQLYDRSTAAEEKFHVRLSDVLPSIRSATADLREASAGAVGSTKDMLEFINKTRWKGESKKGDEGNEGLARREKELDEWAERLRGALEDFKERRRLELVEPYSGLIESQGQSAPAATPAIADDNEDDPAVDMKKSFLPLRGLFVSYVFGASLIAVADVILVLVDLVRSKVAKRRRNRLWAPKGLRALANAVVFGRSGEQLAETLGEGDARDTKEKGDGIDEEDEAYAKDPDSKPPQNGFQRVMNAFHGVYEWTGTAEFLFCFRYTLLSVVLYLPAVFPQSAEFYYAQKGLWALIMAQTTLNIYAGDQIYNYVIRLLGTFIGLIVGLLIWYIGNAKSNGNAYGSAASMAVFLVPLVFVRLYAPVQYLPGVIIMNATVVLIVGYSWIDGHLAVFDPPGIGWPIAWRRWVLVVIGSAASFIIMMLPPKSGRKVVRLRNASTVNKLAQTYTFLMSAWIRTDYDRTEQDRREEDPISEDAIAEGQDPANEKQLNNTGGSSMHSKGLDPRKFPNQWKGPFRQKMISVISQLQGVLQQTEMARWEGNLRGHWPHKDYVRLAQVQLEMTACMSQLAGALWKMDDEWRVSLLHHTNVLNPNFIQDVLTTFSLVSQSLRTGEPIHTVLPQNILERLVYHYTPVYLSALNSGGGKNAREGGNQPRGGIRQVDSSVFKSLDYMYYSAAIVAVFQILECVDELHSITRRLCGEVPFVGFHEWRGTHPRAHDPTAARSS